MSYILDALRRAEAERERGAVPGLNAQPFNPASAKRHAGLQRRRMVIIGLGVLLLIGIAIGLYAALHSAAEPPLPTAAVVAQATGAESATPVPSPAAPASAEASPVPSPSTIVAPTATAPAASARTSRAVTPPPAAAQAARARPSYIDAPPPEPKPVVRKAPTAAAEASAPAAEVRIYKLAELPDNIRAELPKLTLGGSMYSDNPAARMVIVNGQVLHEHDAITNELSLDHITLKAAVFAYKGYKYEMPF